MSYKDSFVYNLRQKVGDMRLITATVDVVPFNDRGEVKMIYANHFDYWTPIGGHVELGDSWQSAAMHELSEEGGIEADEADMELAATMSGPGRIYQYADGTTQPFTLIFVCRKWITESTPTDTEEIADAEWVSVEKAIEKSANPRTKLILNACQKYLETGKVQHIIEKIAADTI